MSDTGIIGLILIIANIVFSYKGFTNELFFERYKFEVDKILINKNYNRLISSGFLHVSWAHLILNMVSLWAFNGIVENHLGRFQFLAIYLASLLGGNLFSLLVHKQHGDYSAVGASGAVCGIIFASIGLFPGFDIGFFGIPLSIPGWLYGIFFILFSIYGIKSKKDNIGHEAHLGGALVGMAVALLFHPSAVLENYPTILLIVIPAIVFIYLIITRPEFLWIDNFFYKANNNYSIDHAYNQERNNKQREIDKILDKINSKGVESLSRKEREKLDEYSRNIH